MSEIFRTVAELMALSARTAPKAVGQDYVVTRVLTGEELERLAHAMAGYPARHGINVFALNGEEVRRSGAVLLIGLKSARPAGLDCGACGYSRCQDLPALGEAGHFAGPTCAWRLVDLGIAVGSAVKTASIHNVDNRIMYTIGVAARKLGLIEAEIAVGIPLSATGKNIYFDRFDPVRDRARQ
jgi:uncharacterized ferredoxin-like protein